MQNKNELLRILVVDDDAPTRMLIRATVTQWGYSVVEAVDGLDALVKLQEHDAPKLVLVDWMMPELDGLSFCARVKKEIKKPPYIILATSFTGATQAIKALDAGADEFLSKPFNPAELRSRLRAGLRILNYEYDEVDSESCERLQLDNSTTRCLSDLSRQLEKALNQFSKDVIDCNLETGGQHKELVSELQRVVQLQKRLADMINSIEKNGKK